MRSGLRWIAAGLVIAATIPALASAAPPDGAICLAVNEMEDMLRPPERVAALRLLTSEFEKAGWTVVADGCSTRYVISHVRLGQTILATLAGPGVSREGTALGVDDLPALYSQLVRSIVSGRPMSDLSVVDRTNVTRQQASVRRIEVDSFGYARLGYGGIFGDRLHGTPAFGFGYRAELDAIGLDVSFLNFQGPGSAATSSPAAVSTSLVRLAILRFRHPEANRSAYAGGGLSWGSTSFSSRSAGWRSWSGSGLQGELVLGYELPRASAMRLFVEADAVLPFYTVSLPTYYGGGSAAAGGRPRYAPSIAVSVGLGWQRGHR